MMASEVTYTKPQKGMLSMVEVKDPVIRGELAEKLLEDYTKAYGEPELIKSKGEVILGDSRYILHGLESESIDLVVTSPPYDNLRKYGSEKSEWNEAIFKEIASQLVRLLKPGGVIVWNVGDKVENGSLTCTSMRQALFFVDELGLNLNDEMIWVKANPMPQVRQPRYSPCYEKMFVFSKGKPKTFNPIMRPCKNAGLKYDSTVKIMGGENGRKKISYNVSNETVDYNVWKMAVAQNKQVYTDTKGNPIKHPAVFPIDLPLRHIMTWTNEGDMVLDPFAGSGTTLLAAMQLNRQFIGVEKNEDYFKIIQDRLEEQTD